MDSEEFAIRVFLISTLQRTVKVGSPWWVEQSHAGQ